jgi:hypothetical protein
MTVWTLCLVCGFLSDIREFFGKQELRCPKCRTDESGVEILTARKWVKRNAG